MGKKYKTKKDPETGLLRITALKDFSNVKKGDKGGLIEKEDNLSQNGDCWVYENARVEGDAMVFGDAKVEGNSEIKGRTNVYCHAKISGNVKLYSTKVSWVTSSIKNNKDYVILTTGKEFCIFSSNVEKEDLTATALHYINNIQTIRQLYGRSIKFGFP
jgi:hypothetical protein